MTDDDLRARLRGVDPAAALAPLDPGRVTRHLENAMTTTLDNAPALRRLPRRWMITAASAVVVLLTGLTAIFAYGGSPAPGPAPAPVPGPAHQQSVTRLVEGGGAAKCRPPTAAVLAEVPLAFEGTVEQIKGGTVTLAATRFFAGPRSDLVEVWQSDGNSEALLGATVFETGRTYLIAAADGQTKPCGYSGLATPELTALYAAAF
jgi:hypothetical protein